MSQLTLWNSDFVSSMMSSGPIVRAEYKEFILVNKAVPCKASHYLLSPNNSLVFRLELWGFFAAPACKAVSSFVTQLTVCKKLPKTTPGGERLLIPNRLQQAPAAAAEQSSE